MIIEDIVSREVVDEYRLLRSYDPMTSIQRGDRKKHLLKPVKTPLADFDVRYERGGPWVFVTDEHTQGAAKAQGSFSIKQPT
jgi:hypothetical protein